MKSETKDTVAPDSGDESTEKKSAAETTMAAMIETLIALLAVAIELLERPHERPAASTGIAASGAVGPIVAMVEGGSREADLAGKLADAEKTIAELRASPSSPTGRRTLPVGLLAKQDSDAAEPGALDAALTSLSLEQRIAVKAQLLRSGLV